MTTTLSSATTPRAGSTAEPDTGVALRATGLSAAAGATALLSDVSVTIEPGELVAIIGASGSGKTTLLDTLALMRPVQRGHLAIDGVDASRYPDRVRPRLGYVPQDDIIHLELPLRRTLRYAAALRLDGPSTALDAAVQQATAAVELDDQLDVRVGSLSGGQRKRASIAVELLAHPTGLFLDEPTSGLDPATAAAVMDSLRRLRDRGSTVVLTTHSVEDLAVCDRIIMLGNGGRLAYHGTLADALAHYGVFRVQDLYARVADDEAAGTVVGTTRVRPAPRPPARESKRKPVGVARQLRTLSARSAETLVRNRLTMAILLAAPALVVAMFAVLFRPGAFDPADPQPATVVMIVFWIAFGGFFFGLTYGLLQVCSEIAIVRRERFAGLSLSAYLLSKLVVLIPFLTVVSVLMLGVLRALDRLPAAGVDVYLTVGITLLLDAIAALALGLATSAAVATPAQAALALPLLCFPAVLFSGAILAVDAMAPVGQAISTAMPDRWAFESIGRSLGLRQLFEVSVAGRALLDEHGNAGGHAAPTIWLFLGAFVVALFGIARGVLARRCGPSTSR
jgi:ABC-type multidrug transport system ATPase subunit